MPTEDDYLNTSAAIREGDLDRLRAVLDVAPEVVTSWLGSIARTPLQSNCQYLWIDLGHAAVSTDGLTAC
jgi:hypothetical protein